jgi:hypothetical protein
MKLVAQLTAALLILIAVYYLQWYFSLGDADLGLLAITLLVVSLLLLSLPGDKWNVRPWFKDTRFGCKWPINGSGWSVSISLIVAIVVTLLIANSATDSASDTPLTALPFIGTIVACWIAIQHIRS